MEIFIRLAGMELGPYSVPHLRESLAEGLLSLKDPARIDGTETWLPVGELLATLPEPTPEPPKPEPVELPREPAPTPAPAFNPLAALDPPRAAIPLQVKTAPKRPMAKVSASRALPLPTSLGEKALATSGRMLPNRVRVVPKIQPPAEPTSPPPEPAHEDPRALPLPASQPERPANPLPAAQPEATSVRIVLKKPGGEAKPDVGIRALAPKSEPEPPKPVEKPAVSHAPPLRVILKKSATAKPTTPAPIQLAPLHVPASAPAVIPEPAPVLVETIATELPKPAREENKPAPRRMLGPVLAIAGAAFGLLIAIYFGSAYLSANSLWQALSAGQETNLTKGIDFPAIRDSLKQQFNLQLTKADPGTVAAVKAMIESSIELYVTPEGLAKLARKSDDFPQKPGIITVSPEVAHTLFLTAINPEGRKQHLTGLDDFVIELETVRLHLKHDGLGWKLYRIDVTKELPFSALPVNGSSTATSTPTLATPVVETYIRQGQAKYAAGDFDGAIADFSQVLTINPKMAAAFNNRAMAKQAKGDFDGAIADFSQALDIDPQLAEVYFSRGNTKSIKGDLDGAMADFSQAISIDPRMEGAYFNRGNARAAKGDFDGAIADLTQVVTVNPSQANAYANRGYARRAKNDLEGAISDYSQAIAIDPKMAAAYYNRGLAKQARGEDASAVLDFNQALDLDPKLVGAYFNRGNAKNTKNDLDGAIADYNQALALDPKIALAYCNRALAKQTKGDFEGALDDYSQALELDPKIAVAFYNRGLIREQRDDLDGSIADSTKALDLDSGAVQAYFNRGLAYLTKGKLEPASVDLSKFCALVPRGRFSDYARLYLWLIAQAGPGRGEANQALIYSLRTEWNSGPDELATRIANFLLDRTTEAELIASADSPDPAKDQDQHCQIWYFAGMKRLLAGDRKMAIEYFRRCLATQKKDYFQYILAKAQLRSLDPASIPSKL